MYSGAFDSLYPSEYWHVSAHQAFVAASISSPNRYYQPMTTPDPDSLATIHGGLFAGEKKLQEIGFRVPQGVREFKCVRFGYAPTRELTTVNFVSGDPHWGADMNRDAKDDRRRVGGIHRDY
jgi:hypothetical protein